MPYRYLCNILFRLTRERRNSFVKANNTYFCKIDLRISLSKKQVITFSNYLLNKLASTKVYLH